MSPVNGKWWFVWPNSFYVFNESFLKDAKFGEKTARDLQKYIRSTPLSGPTSGGAWTKSFLGRKAADFKSGRLDKASDLDSVIEAFDKAGRFENVLLKYSDRPKIRVGDDKIWEKSESALLKAIKESKSVLE